MPFFAACCGSGVYAAGAFVSVYFSARDWSDCVRRLRVSVVDVVCSCAVDVLPLQSHCYYSGAVGGGRVDAAAAAAAATAVGGMHNATM